MAFRNDASRKVSKMKKNSSTMTLSAPTVAVAGVPVVTFPQPQAKARRPRTAADARKRGKSASRMKPVVAPPQFSSYVVAKRRKMSILVCEDASTFARVRTLMHEEHQHRFFGQRFDGVVYMRRDQLAEPGALREVERYLCTKRKLGLQRKARRSITFLVWGDVSRPGIDRLLRLYQHADGLDVHAFLPAYRCMLDRAYGRTLPHETPHPANSFGLRLAAKLGECQKQTLRTVVEEQLVIPQSLVSTRILRKRARG